MHYTVTFPADFKNVAPLRDMVFHTARLQGFDNQKSEHMRSVVDELCTNAIEHGSQPGSEVVLEVHSDESTIKITCQDQGLGNKLKAEEIKKRVSGEVPVESNRGRGISMIVKGFVNELEIHDRQEGGIQVTVLINK